MQNIQKMNVFQQGLVWGVILGIVNLILSAVSNVTHLGALGILVWAIDIVAYLFVGLRAAQVTGRTGTGALVGLLTGLFSAIIASIGTLLNAFANRDALRQSAQSIADKLHSGIHVTNNTVMLTTVLGVIGGLILALVLGLIIGAIGGAIGKGQARHKRVPDPEY